MRLIKWIAGTSILAVLLFCAVPIYAETLVPGYIMASSTLIEPGYDHSAWLVQDYDTSTAWTEGAPGNGMGESLYMETDRYAVITGGVICTGYCRSEDLFYKNGAPTRIYIHTGNQEAYLDVTQDANTYQYGYEGFHFRFDEPLVSDGSVTMTIVGACFTAAAKEAAVPVLSFELEDGTQILDQDNVIKASLINRTDNLGNLEFMIEITFDEEGKEAFQRATVGHVGEVIRILVNGETVSSPVVQEPVTEGKCVLTGGFTQSEAEELIRVLDPEKAAACGAETETEGLVENRPDSEDEAYDSLYEISEILKRMGQSFFLCDLPAATSAT